MDCDAKRLQHGCGLVRKVGWVEPRNFSRHRNELGKHALDVNAGIIGVGAKMSASEPTRLASPAKYVTFEANVITQLEAAHTGAESLDCATRFVTEYAR